MNGDYHDLLDMASNFAGDYLESVNYRTVFPDKSALKALSIFDESLPESSSSPEEVLMKLHRYGTPATTAQMGGRYFGFVNGGSLPIGVASRWLADVWDQNAALYAMSPVASKLEEVCEKWLRELLSLPSDTIAGFVSGTSMSLICGFAAARNEMLKRLGWDVHQKGLLGAPKFRVVVGEQAHGSVFKALSMIGIGRDDIEVVPSDDQGRMRADCLPELDNTTLVIAQAGNVNTGAFDPLLEICKKVRAVDGWMHIDGAFGLWAGASRSTYHLFKGAEFADSWSVDAHKTLNVPYDCGIILCRHKEALTSALQATGAYIQSSEERDGMLYTPEMSRRARCVELWAVLKTLGKEGVEKLIDQLWEKAKEFEQLLQEEGFTVLNKVCFNQVLVQCERPEITQAVLKHIQDSGECWCSGTLWKGKPAIRISVCSWATTSSDIARAALAFVRARAAVNLEALSA